MMLGIIFYLHPCSNAEIIKGYQNNAREPYLYYYRDRDAQEIDLLMESDGKLFPLEIKKNGKYGKEANACVQRYRKIIPATGNRGSYLYGRAAGGI